MCSPKVWDKFKERAFPPPLRAENEQIPGASVIQGCMRGFHQGRVVFAGPRPEGALQRCDPGEL